MRTHSGNHLEHAALVFNPSSGAPGQAPQNLMDIIAGMQALNFVPEVFFAAQGHDLQQTIREVLRRKLCLVVACGGDGTVNPIAASLSGKDTTLSIIPTGTRNNVARSLGIPGDIPSAVALLRTGRRVPVDLGLVKWRHQQRPFLEICSVGLYSALYPAGDDIQHGNLGRLGEFLTTLFSTPAAEMHLVLDRKKQIHTQGHGVVVVNTSFFGMNYQVAPAAALTDGVLDVLVFANVSKLELLSGAVQLAGSEITDPRIQHYRARHIAIDMQPPMPIMIDGVSLGEGPLQVAVRRRALPIIAAPADRRGFTHSAPAGAAGREAASVS